MMLRASVAAAVLASAVVAAGCGGTAPAAPTPVPAPAPAPAPQIPSLVGEWRSLAEVSFDEPNGWKGRYSCPGSWSITSQTGREFSGRAGWQGNGFNGDRYCSYSGGLSGVVNPDGTLTVRFDPIFRTRCSEMDGDGTMSGGMNPDGSATVRTNAVAATCIHDPLGHPVKVTRTFVMTIMRRV